MVRGRITGDPSSSQSPEPRTRASSPGLFLLSCQEFPRIPGAARLLELPSARRSAAFVAPPRAAKGPVGTRSISSPTYLTSYRKHCLGFRWWRQEKPDKTAYAPARPPSSPATGGPCMRIRGAAPHNIGGVRLESQALESSRVCDQQCSPLRRNRGGAARRVFRPDTRAHMGNIGPPSDDVVVEVNRP